MTEAGTGNGGTGRGPRRPLAFAAVVVPSLIVGMVGLAQLAPGSASATSVPSIRSVGQVAYSNTDTTVPVTPEEAGDLMVLAVDLNGETAGTTVVSVSGGGVRTWQLDTAITVDGYDEELWWGTVGTTGGSTITLGLSGSVIWDAAAAQEFNAGVGMTWSAGATGHSVSSAGTITFPSLTPSSAPQLYFGFGLPEGSYESGDTPGFVYDKTPQASVVLWDTDVSSTVSPTAKQNGKYSGSVAGLFVPTSTAPTTTTPNEAPISAIGPLYSSINEEEIEVAPQAAGDLLVLTITLNGTVPGAAIDSVSGGGVPKWSEDASIPNTDGYVEELWWGVVNTPGTGLVSLGVTGSVVWDELLAQEFTAGPGANWTAGPSGKSSSDVQQVTFPSLTPSSTGELYFGYAYVSGLGEPGSTTGFYYQLAPSTEDIVCWDTDVSSTASPTAVETGDSSSSVAGLFRATN